MFRADVITELCPFVRELASLGIWFNDTIEIVVAPSAEGLTYLDGHVYAVVELLNVSLPDSTCVQEVN
jgi:hypothetical protein